MAEEQATSSARGAPELSDTGKAAMAEEAVLNAAMAFAGHVASAAQQAVEQGQMAAPLRQVVLRQYLLETATLCLRRLGESYAGAAEDPAQAAVADLLHDGAARAGEASTAVEALGDLGLDLLDRLLG